MTLLTVTCSYVLATRLDENVIYLFETACLSTNPFLGVFCHPYNVGEDTGVKNGFFDPTKEQEGRDHQGKDLKNDHQGKALREGCREREWARMSVSSREKNDTKRNLLRETTKSKSRMQTVSNGHVSRGEGN